ncbi:MAG: hypothetical protein HY941_01650 [Gammaproteobacteria bacterium]|nr:hypothetical protein [Gammaproteobacteria bacterium]
MPMDTTFSPLLAAVQKNCNIADALHAGDYTLCVYLLKMREYFRWEKGYTFSTPLPRADVGLWLKEREQLWEGLEHEAFARLPINGDEHDPFDTHSLNDTLNPQGLVYSAGLGQYGRPHFFLARLERRQVEQDFTVLIAAEEFARDLAAPPAMTLGNTIFVRRESLRRMIWEKIEEWRWNQLENPMGRAIACYDFGADDDHALARKTDAHIPTLLLHEDGEVMAGKLLGTGWEEMLAEMPRSRIELALRALRDHLADSVSTLPALLEADQPANIHFFFATLTPMRKALAPELLRAYDNWLKTQRLDALDDYLARAPAHWQALAQRALQLHTEGATPDALQSLIDANPL